MTTTPYNHGGKTMDDGTLKVFCDGVLKHCQQGHAYSIRSYMGTSWNDEGTRKNVFKSLLEGFEKGFLSRTEYEFIRGTCSPNELKSDVTQDTPTRSPDMSDKDMQKVWEDFVKTKAEYHEVGTNGEKSFTVTKFMKDYNGPFSVQQVRKAIRCGKLALHKQHQHEEAVAANEERKAKAAEDQKWANVANAILSQIPALSDLGKNIEQNKTLSAKVDDLSEALKTIMANQQAILQRLATIESRQLIEFERTAPAHPDNGNVLLNLPKVKVRFTNIGEKTAAKPTAATLSDLKNKFGKL